MHKPVLRAAARAIFSTARRLDALSSRLHLWGYPISRRWRRLARRNAALMNRHARCAAFVIGNGQSLANQDLRPLASHIMFASNAFWRHPLLNPAPDARPSEWQPRYYCIIDSLFADGSPAMTAFFRCLRSRVSGAEFLVNAELLDVIERDRLLPGDRLRVCILRGNFEWMPSFDTDLCRPMPGLQSVVLLGIAAAMYMGCNPIYLLGMDHDWLQSPAVQSHHFYAGASVDDHTELSAAEIENQHSYLDNLVDAARLFRSHVRLYDIALRRGIQIFNATRGGFLDVYPRIVYEDVVGELNDRRSSGATTCLSHEWQQADADRVVVAAH